MADGERIVGYRVDREISRSSIASVYLGYQESLQRKVLIKRLHPQFARDPEIRARFEREAHALARIKHKNIVHIYDFRADDEVMVLVQEWIDGGSVAEFMEQHGPLSEAEAVGLSIDVLQGLAVAHRERVIHRDIKPSNLMLAGGTIKITDFGLAQFEGSPALTQQGAIMGTPSYMAPEMVQGEAGSVRSDLYSFGVTLYECLTGTNPFQADHISQTLQRVLTVKPDRLEGVHPETNKMLQSLMAKEPGNRPASATEVLEVLQPLAKELGVEKGWEQVAPDLESEEHPQTGDKAAVPASTSGAHSIRPVRRAKPSKFLIGLAWLAMAVIVVGVWFFTRQPELPVDQPGFEPELTQNEQADDSLAVSEEAGPAEDENLPVADEPSESIQDQPEQEGTADQDEQEPSIPTEEQDQPYETGGMITDSLIQETETDETGEDADETAGGTVVSDSIDLALGEEILEPAMPDSGYVLLTVHPWANVYYNNQELGTTPFPYPIRLPIGTVDIDFINSEFPPITQGITVPPGDTTQVTVNLYDLVGAINFIDAVPWAEVSLDGKYIGRTPIGQSFFVQPGQHTLKFTHPTLIGHTETFTIEAGEERRFRINLYD